MKTITKHGKSRGFTLVEVIAAITILGIAAAVALPKFNNMSSEARRAGILAATGTIRSTIVAVRAKAIIAGLPNDATIRQLDMGDGVTIDVQYHAPACTVNGIRKATGTEEFNWYISNGASLCTLYTNKPRDAAGHSVYTAGCAVVYFVNATGAGTWTPETSGC